MGKRFFLVMIAIAAGASGVASAADMRVPGYNAAPAPSFDWTGCFLGASGGGAWGRSKHVSGGPAPFQGLDITPSFDLNGGIIGATWGCNYRIGGWLIAGTESDFSWTNKQGSANPVVPFNTAAVSGTREHWLSTSRVRLGASPYDRAFLYVTGGLATARVEATADIPGGGSFSDTKTRRGWTAGVGAEYALGNRWSVKADYLYVKLNDRDYFNPTPSAALAVRGNVPVDDHILRVGVNYNFGCVLLCALLAKH